MRIATKIRGPAALQTAARDGTTATATATRATKFRGPDAHQKAAAVAHDAMTPVTVIVTVIVTAHPPSQTRESGLVLFSWNFHFFFITNFFSFLKSWIATKKCLQIRQARQESITAPRSWLPRPSIANK
jgi:hypothetical protein